MLCDSFNATSFLHTVNFFLQQAHKHARIRAERDLLKTTKEDGMLIKGTKKEIDVPEAIVELVYTKGQDKFPDKAIQVR